MRDVLFLGLFGCSYIRVFPILVLDLSGLDELD